MSDHLTFQHAAVGESAALAFGPALPVLEAGDHLDRPTFHQRYEAMPRHFRAELIQGIVIVPSPLSLDHADFHTIVTTWLGNYRAATPGTRGLDNATMFLSEESETQPDAALVIDADRGGQTRRSGKYLAGAPELIVEVTSSSEAYDLHEKFQVYEAAGVREYVVLVLRDMRVEWFVSRDGRFERMGTGDDGILRSTVFPGLWLDAAALVAQDIPTLLKVLAHGLSRPEHAEFVRVLRSQKTVS